MEVELAEDGNDVGRSGTGDGDAGTEARPGQVGVSVLSHVN
jgi:hypothetical protein